MKERCTFAIRNVKEAFVCAFVMEGDERNAVGMEFIFIPIY